MSDAGDLLDEVVDRESFLRFVRALIADRRAAGSDVEGHSGEPRHDEYSDWQSDTIDDFLEAASRWADDTDMGQTQGLPAEPSWRTFAVFLYCGKIYE